MEKRILLLDLETAPNKSFHWHGKHEQEIIEIIEQGYILTFAYKWLGDKSVKAFALIDFVSRKKFIKQLHKLFEQADVIVAHNGNQFDIKWANREFVFHKLPPPSPYKQTDTLVIARSKFHFNSNRLDDLGEYLNLGRKIKHEGFSLWKACMDGKESSFRKMTKYNKQDVILLEKVYLILRAWGVTPPINTGMNCPVCGSNSITFQGYKIYIGHKKRRFQCKNCGRWSLSSVKIKLLAKEHLK